MVKTNLTKTDWNDPDEKRKYHRNYYRIKHDIPLDRPIKTPIINWKNPDEVRAHYRKLDRIRNGIPLDKPLKVTRKLNINWSDPKQVKMYNHEISLRKYNFTVKEKNKMLESQEYKCLICNKNFKNLKNKEICIDHDHVTGIVRGLLCINCNFGIGNLGDNLDGVLKAAKYLLNFEKPNSTLKID